jgi:hypothetical protein
MEAIMGYQTIVVHVDQAPNSEARMALAAQLAAQEEGHLVGVALTGVPRYICAPAGCSKAVACSSKTI